MTDPREDPAVGLRRQLQDLFVSVRRPTYRSLETHAEQEGRALRTSTVSDLLNGPAMPRWETVETFVRACQRYAKTHQIQLSDKVSDLDWWHAEYWSMENALANQAARREKITGRAVPSRRRRSAIPAQLPAAAPAFTGRLDQLAELDKLVPGDHPGRPSTVVISAIDGTAGVGKTALAVYWAHKVRDRFPDGQLYINLRGFDPHRPVLEPATAVRGFLDAFEVPAPRIPIDLDAQAALYRSLVADKRMLIVLDNARDSAQVHPLLPGAPGCTVVVTSRNRLTSLIAAHGAHPVTVDLLSFHEARELVARRLGAERVAAEPGAVEEIIARCARLPLALTLVAAHATLRPHARLRELADELRDSQSRWQTLAGDDPATDVQAVFSWSYQTLTAPAARLFRLLGLHPGPDIGAPAAASLAAVTPAEVAALLQELTRTNMVLEYALGRYTLHDLLRAYANQLAGSIDSADQRHDATARVLDHYLHTAHTGDGLLLAHPTRTRITLPPARASVTVEEFADHQQALDWFTAEHAVLLAALNHAAATGFDTHACQMNSSIAVFLYRRGHWHDRLATGKTALAAAIRLADPLVEADAEFGLADAYLRLGEYDEAHDRLSRALQLYAGAGDLAGQAHIQHGFCYLWDLCEQPARALDHARQALDLYQAAGHRAGQANILSKLGWQHSRLGDHQQALDYCRQALPLQQELRNHTGEAHAWGNLGYAHHHLGSHTEAISCHQRAADLFHDLGDRYNEALNLANLGDAHQGAGDYRSSRDAHLRALTILTDLDSPDVDKIRAKLAGAPTT